MKLPFSGIFSIIKAQPSVKVFFAYKDALLSQAPKLGTWAVPASIFGTTL
jgi:hypothetical protein